jgi:solute carrier family 25 phosphate transporter 23/24/25/41
LLAVLAHLKATRPLLRDKQVTYPLDIIRFRMAVDPTLNTIPQVVRAVIRDEGMGAFYKGLVPSCIGIAPYSSINFAAFDLCVAASERCWPYHTRSCIPPACVLRAPSSLPGRCAG